MDDLLIYQRVRNRIIEYLEMMSEFYSNRPPYDLNELLNQWEDWIPQPLNIKHYPDPPYTLEEVEKIRTVNKSWESLCDAIPKIISEEQKVLKGKEWDNFIHESTLALQLFMKRGKLSEEF